MSSCCIIFIASPLYFSTICGYVVWICWMHTSPDVSIPFERGDGTLYSSYLQQEKPNRKYWMSTQFKTFCRTISSVAMQPDDDLVPRYANIFVFIDCENNQFLNKWIIIILILHSGTKFSGWLRHSMRTIINGMIDLHRCKYCTHIRASSSETFQCCLIDIYQTLGI
jgi:hypothetical protein